MSDPTSILLVEDNDGDALIVEELFEEAWAEGTVVLHRVGSMGELKTWLGVHPPPDAILLDLGLPDAVGVDAVTGAIDLAPSVPLVVFTGADDRSYAAKALKAGAQDYLLKGERLTADAVRRAVRYSLDRMEQIRAMQTSRLELRNFADQVAHDLKSPLSSVIGFLRLMQQRDDEDDEYLEIALGSADRLSTMVDELLRYAEGAGRAGMIGAVPLGDVVGWVLTTLADALADVSVEVDEPLPVARGNETALRHALLNVVSNSLKYRSPERPLRIEIAGEHVDGRVLLVVADNGSGIDEDRRAEVFRSGVRGDSSTDGTGFGLAAVRRTTQLFGGSVALDDGIDDVGIAVVFDLPSPI